VFRVCLHNATHVGRNPRSNRFGSIATRGVSSHDDKRDCHIGSECVRVAGPANCDSSAPVFAGISTAPADENPAPMAAEAAGLGATHCDLCVSFVSAFGAVSSGRFCQ
jgi:hypothetical protein